MFTKEEFKNAVRDEIRVIRHLGTKVDPAKADWKPSENQRTTIELLRYLAICGVAPAKATIGESWDVVAGYRERLESMGTDGFDAAMAAEEEELVGLLDAVPEADLTGREVTLPWGRACTLGQALYETTVRFLIAYRMQLFLYVKESGCGELDTFNAWLGMDQPQKTSA